MAEFSAFDTPDGGNTDGVPTLDADSAAERATLSLMRVLIADDHPLYREAVKVQVERTFAGAQPILVGSVAEAVAQLGTHAPFDLIIVDLVMPGVSDSNGIRSVVEAAAGAPVIVVSGLMESRGVRDCIAVGAKAFVPKTLDPGVFASALRIVAAGGSYVPAEFLADESKAESGRSETQGGVTLTTREFEILRMLVAGRSNKEIARELGLQEVTVKVNLTRLFGRLGARNRAQAAAIAVELKLLPSPG